MPATDPALLALLNKILVNQGTMMQNLSSLLSTVQTLQSASNDLKVTATATAANVASLKANQVDPNDLVAIDASLRAITQTVTDAAATLKAS